MRDIVKTCENCGKEIMDDAILCEACAEQTDSAVKNEEKKTNNGKKKNKMKIILPIVGVGAVILAIVLAIAIFVGVMLFSGNSNENVTENPTIEENNGAIEDVDDSEKTTDNSEQGSSNNHSVEPVVGSFDYSKTLYVDTGELIPVSPPYISHINFEADGTGNLTQKTNTSPGFALYETTWEKVESLDNNIKYAVQTNTNETIYIVYNLDLDLCFIPGIKSGRDVAIYFKRYSGNAQENISGGTATTAQDIIGSYNFSYAYNSNTEYKTTTPSTPYIYSLAFYDGGSCLVTTKNSSGLDFLYGSWKYNEPVEESFEYTITHSEGTFALLYFPDYETVVISDNSGMLYYFEKDKD